jgi:hypothetical protein
MLHVYHVVSSKAISPLIITLRDFFSTGGACSECLWILRSLRVAASGANDHGGVALMLILAKKSHLHFDFAQFLRHFHWACSLSRATHNRPR